MCTGTLRFPSQQSLGCWSTSMTADKQSKNGVEVFKNQQQNTKGHHLDLTEVQSWIEREHKPPRINLQFLNAARRVLKTTNRSKSFHVNWYPVRVLSLALLAIPLCIAKVDKFIKKSKKLTAQPLGAGRLRKPRWGFYFGSVVRTWGGIMASHGCRGYSTPAC